MRRLYFLAGAAVLLFAALIGMRNVGPNPRLAQPQPAAEDPGAAPDAFPGTLPGIVGITQEDEFPNGCVDCHRQVEARDSRISTIIAQLAAENRHPDTSEQARTEELPDNCMTCHGADSQLPLSTLSHRDHYEGDDNIFITRYEGQCLHCHSLDREEGIIGIKSGVEEDSV